MPCDDCKQLQETSERLMRANKRLVQSLEWANNRLRKLNEVASDYTVQYDDKGNAYIPKS